VSDFEVSVIIPVYNAAAYVRQAVESALAQPAVREVLLVEDGSPDNALEICRQLASEYPKVVLLRHPNGENRGAGASRNLGMKNASCEYLAFLDADDYYLPGRFAAASEIFRLDLACEGVYEAVGMQVESEEGMERWLSAGKSTSRLQTISAGIKPEELAEALLKGDQGYFLIAGLTIRRSILEKTGLMNEDLRLHQDTEFIQRIALTSRLLPGRLNAPVAIWRVHAQNRISSPLSPVQKLDNRLAMYHHLYSWCGKHARKYQKLLMPLMLDNIISSARFLKNNPKPLQRKLLRLNNLLRYLAAKPYMLVDCNFWQALPGQVNIARLGKGSQ